MNRARLIDGQHNGTESSELQRLLTAQLKAAIVDGEEHIAKSLDALIAILIGLDELTRLHPDSGELIESLKHSAGELVNQLQFFDAHSQRISHVAEAIERCTIWQTGSKSQAAVAVADLLDCYTCDSERAVHREVLRTADDPLSAGRREDD